MKINRRIVLTSTMATLAEAWAGPAFAVTGTITGGKIDPLPIAVTPFIAAAGSENDAATVSGIIAGDL